MFSFRDFIKKGFLAAVGHQPDYWIILNAGGYANQGVLTVDDLAEIQAAIEAQYIVLVPEEPSEFEGYGERDIEVETVEL